MNRIDRKVNGVCCIINNTTTDSYSKVIDEVDDLKKVESGTIGEERPRDYDEIRLRQVSPMAAEALRDLSTVKQPGEQPSNVCNHCIILCIFFLPLSLNF